jgi:hypothetical protein
MHKMFVCTHDSCLHSIFFRLMPSLNFNSYLDSSIANCLSYYWFQPISNWLLVWNTTSSSRVTTTPDYQSRYHHILLWYLGFRSDITSPSLPYRALPAVANFAVSLLHE